MFLHDFLGYPTGNSIQFLQVLTYVQSTTSEKHNKMQLAGVKSECLPLSLLSYMFKKD